MYQNSNGGSGALEPTRGKGKAKNKMARMVEFTWVPPFFLFLAFCRSPFRRSYHQRRLLSLINQPVKGVRCNNQSNGFWRGPCDALLFPRVYTHSLLSHFFPYFHHIWSHQHTHIHTSSNTRTGLYAEINVSPITCVLN